MMNMKIEEDKWLLYVMMLLRALSRRSITVPTQAVNEARSSKHYATLMKRF